MTAITNPTMETAQSNYASPIYQLDRKEKKSVFKLFGGANSAVFSAAKVCFGLTVTLASASAQFKSAVYPDLELVHYQEQIGQVQFTQLEYAIGTVTVRAINKDKTTTD